MKASNAQPSLAQHLWCGRVAVPVCLLAACPPLRPSVAHCRPCLRGTLPHLQLRFRDGFVAAPRSPLPGLDSVAANAKGSIPLFFLFRLAAYCPHLLTLSRRSACTGWRGACTCQSRRETGRTGL
jgi:hypothetical protein